MEDKIIELQEYKEMFENKKKLDNKTISLDELSLEEIENVNKLYISEINKLSKEIETLEEDNKRLKQILGK